MEELLAKLPEWVKDVPAYLGFIVIISTALVRLPGLTKYEENVSKIVGYIQKLLSWLPTLGKNPRTKELEKKVEEKA